MIIGFENGAKSLSRLAEKRRAYGDVTGAVSAYRSALEKLPFDYDANAGLAEVYAEIDLYPDAVNCWFRALSSAKDDRERARAYNGLGANFYFLGRDPLAYRYFNLQLSADVDGEYEYNDIIDQLHNSDDVVDENAARAMMKGFYVAYDHERDRDERAIFNARSLMDEGKLVEALGLIEDIGEDSGKFGEALVLSSFLYVLLGEYKNAIETAARVLDRKDDDLTAYMVMCSAYHGLGDDVTANKYFEQLLTMDIGDTDHIMPMIMVAIDLGRPRDAIAYADRELRESPYNLNLMFIRGLLKYNSGDREGAKKDFGSILALVPNSMVELKLRIICSDDPPDALEYSFDINAADLKTYAEYLRSKLLSGENSVSFEDIVRHCNYIIKSGEEDYISAGMQMLLALDAARASDYLKGVLLDANVSDNIKFSIIAEYIKMGMNMPIKCVTGHIYRECIIEPRTFDGYASELFDDIYAQVAARLYMFDERKISLLDKKIKIMKFNFEINRGPTDMKPVIAAAAVMCLLKIVVISTHKVVCALFGVTEKEIKEALHYFKGFKI